MSLATWDTVAKIFRGYVQYGSRKLEHLVSVDLRLDGGFQTHFSTDGKKRVVSTGDRSTYVLRVDDAIDLYGANGFIDDIVNGIKNNNAAELTFTGVEQAPTGSSKSTWTIKGYAVSLDNTRNQSTGTYETEINLEVTSVTVV